jgi:hypothetical protein
MTADNSTSLSVYFEFPAGAGGLNIEVNRLVAEKSDTGKYVMPVELEMALAAIPGVDLDTAHPRAGKYSIAIGIGNAFNQEELLVNIAAALGKYYETDVQQISVVDRRPSARYINPKGSRS